MTAPAKRKKPLHAPLVNIRSVREAYGLSLEDLAQRISEQSHPTTASTLRGVETANGPVSNKLITAWARALRLNPTDIILPPNGNGNGHEDGT